MTALGRAQEQAPVRVMDMVKSQASSPRSQSCHTGSPRLSDVAELQDARRDQHPTAMPKCGAAGGQLLTSAGRTDSAENADGPRPHGGISVEFKKDLKHRIRAMEGWMYKKGGLNTAVQHRYFVLEDGILAWYTSAKSAANGIKDNTRCITCQGLEIEPDTGLDGNGRFTFAIRAPRSSTLRRIELACVRESERLEWVQALRANDIDTGAGPTLLKRVFGIGAKDALGPASRLIHPLSPFAMSWLALTCLCLAYTAVVTPAVLSFHWLDGPCDQVPTLLVDCAMDVYFLCDIAVCFCLGVFVRGSSHDLGTYHDDWAWVAVNYLSTGFLFDVCTSAPVSFVELSIRRQCAARAGVDAAHISLYLSIYLSTYMYR